MSSDELFLEGLLAALRAAKLEALIVGSVAGALQGAPVTTLDVDLLMRDTPKNHERLQAVAATLGLARPRAMSPLTTTVRLSGGAVPIDVLLSQLTPELTFEALRARAVTVAIGQQVAHVACLEDIIAAKQAAGRPKDLAQLPILRDTLSVKRALDAQNK